VLGSRSSEQTLRAGEQLPAAASSVLSRHLADQSWHSPAAASFRVVAGPDARSNPELSALFWASRHFRVGTRHDRKGLRLEGDPIAIFSDPERLSTPVAPGAIQVAGGQLIVLGVACGTMGGYPHVAHVISADRDRLGQLKAGDLIRFEQVTVDEARHMLLESSKERRALIRRVGLMSQDECSAV
jgi:allophanate hydrolase subunit 2